MSAINTIIVKIISLLPKNITWLFSRRYVAGRTMEEGVVTAQALNTANIAVTMDVLGEEIETLQDAEQEKTTCLKVLKKEDELKIDGTLSLKLTSLGLKIDKELCFASVRDIVAEASRRENFVRLDMEDSTCTDETLDIYRRLRKEYDNVGAVIQAYLKRSRDDVASLIDEGIANLRLCKGIYVEPKEIAFKERARIRKNFLDLIEMMLDKGSYTALATHDTPVIQGALEMVRAKHTDPSRYEFQMLLGVTEKQRDALVKSGHHVRVYVPFGESWHAYSMRRLRENPVIVGHIIKNMFIRS